MLKLAIILLVAIVLFRATFGVWPWALARGPADSKRALADARRRLGVKRGADRTEILAAHRLLLTRVHPDRGGTAEAVHEADRARDQLLSELGTDTVEPHPEDERED
ncbi:MAG: J domain-containing protein [Erythrobacter sp.]|jgi:hypothetical protein|nr:J domain-containing protein [Erythrobacter sp.]